MKPIRIDAETGLHVFLQSDIDLYGQPEYFGYKNFMVVEEKFDFGINYEDEVNFKKVRPIHRYDRVERFKSVLYHLVGERGGIEDEVLELVRHYGYDEDRGRIWESIRGTLKRHGLRRYYNRIKTIICILGWEKKVVVQNSILEDIVKEFKRMSRWFDNEYVGSKKYFPPLRFIALKLLIVHGEWFSYEVPLVRTERKKKPLQEIWEELFY